MSVNHSEVCIDLKQIGFSYNETPVLESVNASISEGDFVGIIGPNGGGKTTLLKIILGLLEPTVGEVKIFGHSVSEAKEHFEVGYVPQHIAQLNYSFPATVREVVRSGLTRRRGLFHWFNTSDELLVDEILTKVGISNLASRPLDALSGGQRQRVFIARALVGSPRLLILDEPTVGVDSDAEAKVDELLAMLNTQDKMTIIMVSHDVDAVLAQVKHVLCVSKTVMCHAPSKQFDKNQYFQDIYGTKNQTVSHEHS